jgi:uncharacterized phage-like protein YoqJ
MIVSLTGHRKLGSYQIPNPTYTRVYSELTKLLIELKPIKLLSGMALGWDMLGVKVALDLGIPFDAVVPFIGQEKRWYPKDQVLYHQLLKQASNVIVVSEGGYDYWKLHARNMRLVDSCNKLISCYDGRKEGGTYHCLKYAQKVKREVININPNPRDNNV